MPHRVRRCSVAGQREDGEALHVAGLTHGPYPKAGDRRSSYIWGAVAFGAAGAAIACRRHGLSLTAVADTVAPGIVIAQAIGRWGNYFNQELYGGPTRLPWALHITRAGAAGYYQPTFLYESLWDLGVAALLVWADRRYRLDRGRLFALYVAAYTAGRGWIEALRVDHANHLLGLRLNDWTAVLVLAGSLGSRR